MTTKSINRLLGIFLVVAGLLYILIQLIHPVESLETVGSSEFFVASVLTIIMSLFSFVGLLFVVKENIKTTPILTLLGYSLFGLFWLASMMFSFVEAFVLPLIVDTSETFTLGILTLFSSNPPTDLGYFPALVNAAGIFYIVGGVLLGISIIRSKVLPAYSGLLLAVASLLTILAGLLGHPMDRILAVPMGLSFIVFGIIALTKKIESY